MIALLYFFLMMGLFMNMLKTLLATAIVASSASAMATETNPLATAVKTQAAALAIQATAPVQAQVATAQVAAEKQVAQAVATQQAVKTQVAAVADNAEKKLVAAKTELAAQPEKAKDLVISKIQENCTTECEVKKVAVEQVVEKTEKKGFFSWFKKSA